MTTYTAIPTASLAVDKPGTSPLVLALRDNPAAIAEGDPSAPVNRSGWHPYDKVTNGDAFVGTIYSFAVDGTVATLTTPDFEDGYEYQIQFENVGTSFGATDDLQINVYRATSAAYSGVGTIFVDVITSIKGALAIYRPRQTLNCHFIESVISGDLNTNTVVTGAPEALFYKISHTTAQKVLKLRFSWVSGSINAGKIYMHRRKAF